MKEIELSDNRRCFACGPDNPIGLHLQFSFDGSRITAEFVPLTDHQGYSGITHGGILATVLDEAMARLLWDQGESVVTATFDMRLKRPTTAGERLRVEAWVHTRRGRIIMCQSHLLGEDGQPAVQAKGAYMRVNQEKEGKS